MLLAATGTQMLVALLLPWPLKILVDNVLSASRCRPRWTLPSLPSA